MSTAPAPSVTATDPTESDLSLPSPHPNPLPEGEGTELHALREGRGDVANDSTFSTAFGPTPRRSASGTVSALRGAAGGEDGGRPRRGRTYRRNRRGACLPPQQGKAANSPADLSVPLQLGPVPRPEKRGRVQFLLRRRQGRPARPSSLPPFSVTARHWAFIASFGATRYSNVSRMLDRQSLRDFEMRVLFQMNANDSSSLMDTPEASRLGVHRALFYDEGQGRMEKFRPYGLPSARMAGLGQSAVRETGAERFSGQIVLAAQGGSDSSAIGVPTGTRGAARSNESTRPHAGGSDSSAIGVPTGTRGVARSNESTRPHAESNSRCK